MAAGLKRVRFGTRQLPTLEKGLVDTLRGVTTESTDETARRYIGELFGAPAVDSMSLTDDASSAAPELSLVEEKDEPLTNTVHVSYQQTFNNLPIYGARIGVELTKDKDFVGLDGSIAAPPDVDTVPTLSAETATQKVRELLGDKLVGDVAAPTLGLRFGSTDDTWKLAYVFDHIFVRSAGTVESPERDVTEERPYRLFLDAHTGAEIVRAPLFRHAGAVAASGKDLSGRTHSFGATAVSQTEFLLHDPDLKIRTCSLSFGSYRSVPTLLPGTGVKSASIVFEQPAAVAAHAHAAIVSEFYRTVLKRNGIDGNGMEIVSAVDCVQSTVGGNRTWRNAVWIRSAHAAFPAEVNRGMMLYGQVKRPDGRLVSIAEGLEVVGHELTHGITDYTADLEYVTQSGALNESYSDILGAIILNRGKAIADWDWEFGGILNAGKALRNLADPTLCGQPAHMNDFAALGPHELPGDGNDHGHVHANSGIHNKAAHGVITSGVFTWQEAAQLFYLTLTTPGRLNPTSNFSDSRAGVLASCESLFAGIAPDELEAKLDAIRTAFDNAGITDP